MLLGRMPKRSSVNIKKPQSLKSYLARISDASHKRQFSAFAAFPKDTSFDGQEQDENIVLLIRQHPAVFIPLLLVLFGMIILPPLLYALVGALDTDISSGNTAFGLGLLILWGMLTASFALISVLKWYFNVNIVTNQRIVDIDFDQLFNHRVSEAQLEKIEDVSHAAVGMWAVVFDFGNVYVQTAAEQREFEFVHVPRPRDIQDTINDLLELKQKNG